ncbi:hypothetical protein [Ornithinimicrobium kibberense]|uniref:hypothetical protein n=1 Tax=Ornithinimicrobium kibberense TaxID=282060 RepID=UPI003616A038
MPPTTAGRWPACPVTTPVPGAGVTGSRVCRPSSGARARAAWVNPCPAPTVTSSRAAPGPRAEPRPGGTRNHARSRVAEPAHRRAPGERAACGPSAAPCPPAPRCASRPQPTARADSVPARAPLATHVIPTRVSHASRVNGAPRGP